MEHAKHGQEERVERQNDRESSLRWEDEEDRHDMTGGDPAGTRRGLLAQTAGGFALAASGLFLPSEQDEAEAKRPTDRLGDRTRSRSRKRRNQRGDSHHGKHKKDNGNDGKGEPAARRGIRFNLYNATLDGEFGAEFYAWRGEDNLDYEHVNGVGIDPYPWSNFHSVIVEDDAVEAYLWVANRYYINAYNPNVVDMWGGLGWGGHIDSRGNWVDGAIKVRTESFFPGQHLRFRDEEDGFALDIVLKREADAEDHKSFVLWIGDGQGPFDPGAEAASA